MKFKINRNVLLESLTKVSKAISQKSVIASLTGIKITVDDKVTLLGSNTTISIQSTIEGDDVTIEETGTVVISSKILLDIIKKVESSTVTITELDNNKVRVKAGKSKFDLNSTPAVDYPKIPLDKAGIEIELDSNSLSDIINQTAFCATDIETRPILTGVNFKAKTNKLICTATDSYRLSRKSIELNKNCEFNIVIPKSTLLEMNKILKKGKVNLFIDQSSVMFECEDGTLIKSRLIEGAYPDTERLIPSQFNTELSFESDLLLASLERTSVLTDEKNHTIELLVQKDEDNSCSVDLKSQCAEIGSVEERLENVDMLGNDIHLWFNGQFLKEALKGIKGNNIIIKMVDNRKPFIIIDKANDDIVHLLLPLMPR